MPDRLPLILVCDDTPAKRYIISSWLRRDGYRVIEATTAGEARRLLREQAIDLAVLDVHLPDGSGLDITRDLRRDPELSGTPVVHVSAIAMETEDRVAGLDRGADAYLIDPIEPQELLSSIRTLLRSSGARKSAEELSQKMGLLNAAAVRINLAASVRRLGDALARAAAEVLEDPATTFLVDGDVVRRSGAAPGGRVDDHAVLEVDEAGFLSGLDPLTTVAAGAARWLHVADGAGPANWRVCRIELHREVVGAIAVPVSGSAQRNDDYLLEQLARLAAVALDNLRALEREHQTALVLQRSLLPSELPGPPGLNIVTRYRASERYAEVGGDFFDAFEVESGTYVVIGDVEGHSLQAAVVMAELRYSLRAYAYDGHGPADITDRIDAVLARSHPGMIATATLALIAPDRDSMCVVSAGHPATLLLRDGEVMRIKPKGVLLGILAPHEEHFVDLRPGDRMLMFTDGLVERRDEAFDDSMDRLVSAVAVLDEPDAEVAADRILDQFGTSEDDVALVVVDVLPPT